MSSFSIQFHATPSELRELVARWLSAYPIHAAAVSYQPYSATEFDGQQVDRAFESRPRRVVFAAHPLSLDVTGNAQLLDRNPGALVLELGSLTEKGLGESQLSTKDASETWKAIYRDVKKGTAAGATAVNEASGATAPARSHRHTPGAKALWRDGTRMLTAGSAVLRFD